MKILLTGGTGFIGAALSHFLCNNGYEVHVVVRGGGDRSVLPVGCTQHEYDGSLNSVIKCMEKVRPDVVIHLASLFIAEHHAPDVSNLIDSNIHFGIQLLESMRCSGVNKFINTGTYWQYYSGNSVRSTNLYAATKQAFESMLDYYVDAHDISQITLNLCDTYGPNDRRRKLLNVLVQYVPETGVLDMTPGDQIVDLLYIDDVVSAYIRAIELVCEMQQPCTKKYLLTGYRYSVKEIVRIVSETSGKNIDANFGGRPYRSREIMNPCNNSMEALPGWKAIFDLPEGISMILKSR